MLGTLVVEVVVVCLAVGRAGIGVGVVCVATGVFGGSGRLGCLAARGVVCIVAGVVGGVGREGCLGAGGGFVVCCLSCCSGSTIVFVSFSRCLFLRMYDRS